MAFTEIFVRAALFVSILVVCSCRDEFADAIMHADVRRVELLLGLDPNILSSFPPVFVDKLQEPYGRTPLMLCGLNAKSSLNMVDEDCHRIAQLARWRGTNLSHVDKNGWTPLSMAAMNGFTKMCEFIVDQGVTIDTLDDHGLTPLMKAAAHGHVETFRLLYGKGANVTIQDSNGLTALHHTVNNALSDATFVPVLMSIVDVVNSTVIDTTRDKDGRNILMYAVINKHVAVSELLLNAGCNPTLVDSFGVSLSNMSRLTSLKQLVAEATARWTENQHKEWMKKTSKKKSKEL